MMPLIVIGILVVGAIFILAGMYNSLVQLRVRADSAWSDIDVQLKRRHDLIPNLVETVKGYAVDNWIGMLAPVRVPQEIIAKLNADVLKTIGTPELKERLTQQGFDVQGGTPEQFGAVIRADIEKYTKVIRSAGIKE